MPRTRNQSMRFITQRELYEIEEKYIDRVGMTAMLEGLSQICFEKAEHIMEQHGARDPDARMWMKAGKILGDTEAKLSDLAKKELGSRGF